MMISKTGFVTCYKLC